MLVCNSLGELVVLPKYKIFWLDKYVREKMNVNKIKKCNCKNCKINVK